MPKSPPTREKDVRPGDVSALDAGQATLVATLFSSLAASERWVDFLDGCSAMLRASHATLIITPPRASEPAIMLTPHAEEEARKEYANSQFSSDPFVDLPDGTVCHFRKWVKDLSAMEPRFRSYMERTGYEVLGVDLHVAEDLDIRLRVSRLKGEPRFTVRDERRLQGVVPFLRIAGRLFAQQAREEIERGVYSGAIEQMAVGIALLDSDGRVLRSNAVARDALDGEALRLSGEVLTPTDLVKARALREFRDGDGERMNLRLDEGQPWLTVVRLALPGHVAHESVPHFIVYISDPERAPSISADALRGMFDLTATEAQIAATIASGLSLDETAALHGSSRNTVRAHLRSIYGKTGTNSQARLASLIARRLANLVSEQ